MFPCGGSMEIVSYSYSSGRDLELELPPLDVKRQDSLYRDATMPAHAGHHGQVPACWSLDGMANQLATLLTASPQFSILVYLVLGLIRATCFANVRI